MQLVRMCGVVLWSSVDEGRAVIWCEDQGNLAFYKAMDRDAHGGAALDPGDLIEFDLDDADDHRIASNPRLLVEDHAPRIAHGLRSGAQAMRSVTDAVRTMPASENSNVVMFPHPRRSDHAPRVAIA